jgi:hypothetical protein
MKVLKYAIPISLLVSSVIFGQPVQKQTSIDDIIEMSKAGLSESLIITTLRKEGQAFTLRPADLVRLKQSGVSDAVMQAMLDPSSSTSTAPVVAASAPASPTMELGVYAMKEGAWIALEPELVNIKQSSVYKIYAGGIDTNGYINGASSKTTLRTPIEITLVTSEGVSASEYQLVRLRASNKNNTREFRVGRFGLGGGKSGVDRDKITFDFKKIQPRQFTITLPSSVVAGEYAFLPPMSGGGGSFGGQLASGGKAFTFRVLE